MPRKLRYSIVWKPPKDVRTNADTEETTVGSITRGAQISREQPRDRALPFSFSANRAPASRVNEPFCALRNDKRLAPSSTADDPQTPTECTETWHRDEVANNQSEDEDYDPETDEVSSFDDHINDLFAAQEAEDSNFFSIHFLKDGVRKTSKLKVKEAIALPSNTKIILPFHKELQPIGQAAGLLSGFLGSLGADYSHFPICEESWKHVNKAMKEHAYDMIKEKDQGRPVGRGELFIITHKEKNGSYIHPDAHVVSEHLGRVRALGAGPCPTQVFGNAAGQPSSSSEPNNEEYERRIAELTAKIEEEQVKRQSIKKVLGYIIQQQGGNLLADVAAVLDYLGSTLTSSRARPSSSSNHDPQQK
ncbi:hypothetical protein Ahy_A03g010345 [Arachis hypogaea]|uniref:Transposase Tnp1/En/Spm-like domain-containing protein n=1 Tax=Arachis hypogaea TaxID=3818 RepID=A0A445DMF4_ARAHY|nr:hypothetical protein Ahy_A03g010345 [Arachis hypogaea]